MAKKVDPSMLQAIFARMTLQQLQEARANLVDQLAVLDQIIKYRSPEMSSNE